MTGVAEVCTTKIIALPTPARTPRHLHPGDQGSTLPMPVQASRHSHPRDDGSAHPEPVRIPRHLLKHFGDPGSSHSPCAHPTAGPYPSDRAPGRNPSQNRVRLESHNPGKYSLNTGIMMRIQTGKPDNKIVLLRIGISTHNLPGWCKVIRMQISQFMISLI